MDGIEKGKKFTVALSASGADEGDVSLVDFHQSLAAIYRYLTSIDASLHGKKEIEWIVSDLHHSRPTVTLEAQGPSAGVLSDAILNVGQDSIRRLAKGDDAPILDTDAIESIKSLLRPIGRSVRNVEIIIDDVVDQIDVNFVGTFNRIQFTINQYNEEWYGTLEEVNLHSKDPTFRLYPVVGRPFITCEFDRAKRDKVTEALTHKVCVNGLSAYRPNAKYPHRIKVRDFTIFEGNDEELSNLLDVTVEAADHDAALQKLIEIRHGWN